MDDYNVNVLSEAKNEYSSRLVTILTPLIIEGIKSIFAEACKLCLDNDETGVKAIDKALLDMSDRFLVSYINIPKPYKDVQDIRQATQLHKVLENKTYW